jgi:hypothetical protein
MVGMVSVLSVDDPSTWYAEFRYNLRLVAGDAEMVHFFSVQHLKKDFHALAVFCSIVF